MTILGSGLDLTHAYNIVTPKTKVTSVQPLAITHCGSLRVVTTFLSSFDRDLSVGSLALPSCW